MGLIQSSEQQREEEEEVEGEEAVEEEGHKGKLGEEKKNVLEQETEILPCHPSASLLSPQLLFNGSPYMGPSVRVWDPYNILTPVSLLLTHSTSSSVHSNALDHSRWLPMEDDLITEIYLIRHAESTMNETLELIGGRSPSATLTANGKRQARALGVFLKSQGIIFNAMYSSPLAAKQTALAICQRGTKMMCEERRDCTVCVTGAGGFIASWLIKDLLLRGYNVNGTVRDPGDERKTAHILSLPGAKERLRLFKANLNEEGSFDTALQGCEFAILLATPMDFAIDAEAQTAVVEAEVKGTVDILKACAKAKSVRRVIYTSSINAASPLNNDGKFMDCVDESCWTPVDLIRREKPLFWMYYVAKTLSEQAALQYGSDHSIEVVTLAPALVAGPSLTPTLPASIEEALGLITGSQECYEWLKEFQWLMGSIALVHIDDLCDAYIFLMEHQSAKGRFICCAQDLSLKELWDFCNKRYSQFCPPLQYPKEDDFLNHVPISSKRLLDLGFSYNYGLPDIFDESIEFAKTIGILQ